MVKFVNKDSHCLFCFLHTTTTTGKCAFIILILFIFSFEKHQKFHSPVFLHKKGTRYKHIFVHTKRLGLITAIIYTSE